MDKEIQVNNIKLENHNTQLNILLERLATENKRLNMLIKENKEGAYANEEISMKEAKIRELENAMNHLTTTNE
jgi:hypothetical protein